jgi:hypothetical protein
MSNDDDNKPRELGAISKHAFDRMEGRVSDEEKTQIENAVRIAWGRRDCLSLAVVCKDLGKEYREAEDGSNGNLIIATVKSGGKYHHDGELVTVMLRSDRQLVKKGMLECSHLAWMVPKRPTGEHARKQQRKQRRFLNRR